MIDLDALTTHNHSLAQSLGPQDLHSLLNGRKQTENDFIKRTSIEYVAFA